MLTQLLGTVAFMALLAIVGLGLYFVYWVFGGGAWNWTQERKERRELKRAEEVDHERGHAWDAQRAAELAAWVRSGALPATVMRTYPTPEELTWDWARLHEVGYEMDHDPVVLADGQLMVNYSLSEESWSEPAELRVVHGELPSPPN